MLKKEIKILEIFVGILDIFLISACAFYFYKMQWLVGIFFIIMSLLMTNISLGLKHNIKKSNSELKNRVDLSFKVKSNEEWNEEEAEEFGRALNHALYIVWLSVAVILFSCDMKWYFLVPLSFIIGVVFPAMLYKLGLLFKK